MIEAEEPKQSTKGMTHDDSEQEMEASKNEDGA
jgi:hypothetical protein